MKPEAYLTTQIHSQSRGEERYGERLSQNDTDNMVRQIADNRGIFLRRGRKGTGVRVWLVWWETAQRIVPVYYSPALKQVVTILPLVAANDRHVPEAMK